MTTNSFTNITNRTTITTAHGSNTLFPPPMRPILDTNVIFNSTKKTASTTAPAVADVFGRPMDPCPAPLVYLNGGPGVGKGAVAECLLLLLGQDKSLLVDVRGVGWDGDDEELDESTLMTPENPGYFDYDNNPDYGNSNSPGYFPNNSIPHPPPSTFPPCSDKKLARLLERPGNTLRIAIIEFCAFDTPAGHAAMSTFAAAAGLAGRLFIPIALTCEPAEQMRRAQSLQRQCSYKNRRRVSIPVDGGGVGSSGGSASSNSFSIGGDMNGGGYASRGGQLQGQQPQLPLACPVRSGGGEGGEAGSRSSLSTGHGGDGVGVANNGYELTVDITKTSAFETALQLVELVKMLAAERDAIEQRQQQMLLYGRKDSESRSEDDCSSVMTTPVESLGDD